MGKAKLIKSIDRLFTGVFMLGLLALVIVENSLIISESDKRMFELGLFLFFMVMLVVFMLGHWKENRELDELNALVEPVDPWLVRTAESYARKLARIELILFLGVLPYLITIFYSYWTRDSHLLGLVMIWAIPMGLLPMTMRMITQFKLQKLKEEVIPEPIDQDKLLKKPTKIIVDYVVAVLSVFTMWLGGFRILDPLNFPFWLMMTELVIFLVMGLIMAGAALMNYKEPKLPKDD